jgi:hypothetical protein
VRYLLIFAQLFDPPRYSIGDVTIALSCVKDFVILSSENAELFR